MIPTLAAFASLSPESTALAACAGVASWSLGTAFGASFVATYVLYEWIHRRAHRHRGVGAYGRFLRRHHFHHHFGNPRANHGVTSPLWDLVFGTFERPGRIRVPDRLCMRWLIDPRTGDVFPELAASYELRRTA